MRKELWYTTQKWRREGRLAPQVNLSTPQELPQQEPQPEIEEVLVFDHRNHPTLDYDAEQILRELREGYNQSVSLDWLAIDPAEDYKPRP